MIPNLITEYTKTKNLLEYYRRLHDRLMTRVFLSYGIAIGMLFGILFLLGSRIPVPISFAVFEGWIFLYGCVMLVLANRHLNNRIRPTARDVCDRWEDIFEMSNR